MRWIQKGDFLKAYRAYRDTCKRSSCSGGKKFDIHLLEDERNIEPIHDKAGNIDKSGNRRIAANELILVQTGVDEKSAAKRALIP